jgi:hypothetical protein
MSIQTRKIKNLVGGNAAPKKTKRAQVECAEDDEMCARATTDIQEDLMLKLFKGEAVNDSDINTYFKCGAAKIHTLVANLNAQIPFAKRINKKDGWAGQL